MHVPQAKILYQAVRSNVAVVVESKVDRVGYRFTCKDFIPNHIPNHLNSHVGFSHMH